MSAAAVGGIVGSGEVEGAGDVGDDVGPAVLEGVGRGEDVAGEGDPLPVGEGEGDALPVGKGDSAADRLGLTTGLGLVPGRLPMLDAIASANSASTIAVPTMAIAMRLDRSIRA